MNERDYSMHKNTLTLCILYTGFIKCGLLMLYSHTRMISFLCEFYPRCQHQEENSLDTSDGPTTRSQNIPCCLLTALRGCVGITGLWKAHLNYNTVLLRSWVVSQFALDDTCCQRSLQSKAALGLLERARDLECLSFISKQATEEAM